MLRYNVIRIQGLVQWAKWFRTNCRNPTEMSGSDCSGKGRRTISGDRARPSDVTRQPTRPLSGVFKPAGFEACNIAF